MKHIPDVFNESAGPPRWGERNSDQHESGHSFDLTSSVLTITTSNIDVQVITSTHSGI